MGSFHFDNNVDFVSEAANPGLLLIWPEVEDSKTLYLIYTGTSFMK